MPDSLPSSARPARSLPAPSRFGALCLLSLVLALAACQSLPQQGTTPPAIATAAPPPAAEPVAPVPPRPEPPPVRPLRVGIALGSGAARGFAHVGVLRALEARGIVPDIIVGTSVGSFVGALYATGMSGADLERVALQFEQSDIADWALPARGILKGEALQNFINQRIGGQRTIESLPRRLGIVATDLHTGQMVVFERGNVGMAVRASSSVPGVFRPVEISGREYVDGGLVSPVPTDAARRMGADLVIAVDISRDPAHTEVSGTFDVLLQTFNIMEHVIAQRDLAGADVVIRPRVGDRGSTDFQGRESAILEGGRAVTAASAAIDAALDAAHARLVAERDAAWAASMARAAADATAATSVPATATPPATAGVPAQ